jgi:hypothetical protein
MPSTWLSDYLSGYRKAYGESPTQIAIKRMARVFKQLEEEYPREEVVGRFGRYCKETPIRYYSVERFGDVFAAWRSHNGKGLRDAYLKPSDFE